MTVMAASSEELSEARAVDAAQSQDQPGARLKAIKHAVQSRQQRDVAAETDGNAGGHDPAALAETLRNKASLWAAMLAQHQQKTAGGALDISATVRQLQTLQHNAEAAAKVQPCARDPKQLKAIIKYVCAAAPFAAMSDEQMLNIARSFLVTKTKMNERIVREGTVGGALFIVISGQFAVYQRTAATSSYDECVPAPLQGQPRTHCGIDNIILRTWW